MPSICVLIPAYNSSAFIGEALESIACQTQRPDQVILIDDGSTDGTADAAEIAARRLKLAVEVFRQTNQGPAAARNAGLKLVRTALVALLDSDDILLPDHLRLLGTPFERYPELVGCFGDQEAFDEKGIIQKSFLAEKPILRIPYEQESDGLRIPRLPLFSGLLTGNYIPTSGSVLSVSKLRQIGGYNESLRTSEDRELLARLSLIGPFAYYPLLVARKREHRTSLTTRPTVAIARNSVDALLCLCRAKLNLTQDQQDSLDTALRETVKDFLYRASCDGIAAYLAARRWIANSMLPAAPLASKDLVRALLRDFRGRREKV